MLLQHFPHSRGNESNDLLHGTLFIKWDSHRVGVLGFEVVFFFFGLVIVAADKHVICFLLHLTKKTLRKFNYAVIFLLKAL